MIPCFHLMLQLCGKLCEIQWCQLNNESMFGLEYEASNWFTTQTANSSTTLFWTWTQFARLLLWICLEDLLVLLCHVGQVDVPENIWELMELESLPKHVTPHSSCKPFGIHDSSSLTTDHWSHLKPAWHTRTNTHTPTLHTCMKAHLCANKALRDPVIRKERELWNDCSPPLLDHPDQVLGQTRS